MQTPTNRTGISLALSVWLVDDLYDFQPGIKQISATGLLKPLRHIILGSRLSQALPGSIPPPDLSEFIARRMGHSLHDSIERAWTERYAQNLRLLGHPEHIIQKVRVNPTDKELASDPLIIPVYIEQRGTREINGWTVSGKFDMVIEGILQDTKSTSAWTWAKGSRDEEHIQQMSIYKWVDQARDVPIITADHFEVNYIFTDWQKALAKSNPNYPQSRLENKKLLLMGEQEVTQFITSKLGMIERYWNAPEPEIPECTDDELWRSEPVWKYYSNPATAAAGGRATKNFDDAASAHAHQAARGGIVIHKPGEPKRCEYCESFPICTQKDKF